jgi:hypothetical protein
MSRVILFFLGALAGPLAWAQTAPPGHLTTAPEPQPFFTRIRGLFDFDLPNIDPPGTIKLVLHPHLGDFIRHDYLRLDGGLRWAVNDHFEINPETTVYGAHGLGGSNADGYGVGEVRLGTKYILRRWPSSNYETSIFLNVEVPVGHPPVDLTDGLNHFAPGFLVQHQSERNAKLITFSGAGLDLVAHSTIAGTPARNQPRDDSANVTAGAIYDLGQFKWTLSATYATTAGLGGATDHFFYLRPSLVWIVPKKYTFNFKTQWIVGLGLRASWGPDGSDLSISNKVRAEITFRQVMEKLRPRSASSAGPR